MGFVKAGTTSLNIVAPESRQLPLERLAGNDADERRRAARLLSRDPGTASALAACLQSEPDAGVREALFGGLVDIGGPAAAEFIAPFLRSADAGIRGEAIESLKRLGEQAVAALDGLLADADPDVRLLAIEVTRVWPPGLADPRLHRIIQSEPHVNVCIAAVDVATEVGTSDLLAALTCLPARFPGDAFLAFAVDVACARIQAAGDRSP